MVLVEKSGQIVEIRAHLECEIEESAMGVGDVVSLLAANFPLRFWLNVGLPSP